MTTLHIWFKLVRAIYFFVHKRSVHTKVRVKAGAWSGFQLVRSILPVNFRIKWLLWNVQVCPSAFGLPGSHKVWARSWDQSSTSTSSSSTPQHHLSSYPGIPTNPTMTRPKVECSFQQVWPPYVQYILDHCLGINLEWNWMNLNVLGCCVRRHEIVKLCDIVLLELVATTF